jgi:transcriptional regulator with XRE-family HTH domain
MNDLYRLIKLRGTTLRQIARETGASYHPLQKTAKGVRRQPRMQKTLAAYFGVDAKLLFGPRRAATIRLLLEREIDRHANRQGEKLRRDLRRRYLGAA